MKRKKWLGHYLSQPLHALDTGKQLGVLRYCYPV